MGINKKIEVGQTKYFVEDIKCIACGYLLNAATSCTGDEVPVEGDISICISCGHVMAFADDCGNLRDLNDAEMREVAGHPTILRIQKARRLAADRLNRSDDTGSR